jgi:hypothetical protein
MTRGRKSRKLVVGIATVTATIVGTYLWSYASSCGCINLKDIDAFYKDQVAQQNEYKKQHENFKIIEDVAGRYDWTMDRNNDMMNDINKAVTGVYDPSAMHIGAETNGFTCSITSYQWRFGPLGSPAHEGDPDPCLKELVDAHEQVHIDECKRVDKFWNYKQYKTMEETAAEEIKATQAGMDSVNKLKQDLERQFCCKLPVSKNETPKLRIILANLFR